MSCKKLKMKIHNHCCSLHNIIGEVRWLSPEDAERFNVHQLKETLTRNFDPKPILLAAHNVILVEQHFVLPAYPLKLLHHHPICTY